jgi:RNA polymerase sigma-70 factor (ECF subfamily)
MDEINERLSMPQLVDQHYELLYRYAYRLCGSASDAEDLTQETFCTAQAKLHQLRSAGCVRGWLCKVLRNHYLLSLRNHAELSLETVPELPGEPAGGEELLGGIDSERVQRVLNQLPEALRTPVVLFYFEEFSYRQIAEQMGVPIGTVMSRLARAKAHLRSRLQPHYAASRFDSSTPGVT